MLTVSKHVVENDSLFLGIIFSILRASIIFKNSYTNKMTYMKKDFS